jgi:hypothetical protein
MGYLKGWPQKGTRGAKKGKNRNRRSGGIMCLSLFCAYLRLFWNLRHCGAAR